MRWYFPQWNGDFRLEARGADASLLVLHQATEAEIKQVHAFLNAATKKKWLKKGITINATDEIELKASVNEAGKLLLSHVRPQNKAVLTAVRMVDGKLQAVDETGELSEGAIDELMKEDTQAAVSVSRPTPSCPDCVPGAIGPASEVLQTFMTPDEHESWAKNRQIIVTGGISGHRYLLSHRHHPRAVKDTRICFDLDKGYILKFFDWGVPPEEEILAAKLILEHREPWLRNEASLYHVYTQARAEPILKNPFGNYADGVDDATFMAGFGTALEKFRSLA